jgi:hypothetical protein
MHKQNLRVLTPTEFNFLETRKWDGVYNNKTREVLYDIIKKLKREKNTVRGRRKNCIKFFRKPILEYFWTRIHKLGIKSRTPVKYRYQEILKDKLLLRQFL